MSDLEDLGLLFAPHTSAGRMPTEAGLRLYVDGLLEFGGVGTDEREKIESHCAGVGKSMENVLSDALEMLSGLSQYAGIVMAPTTERAFRHVEFVPLGTGRALGGDGQRQWHGGKSSDRDPKRDVQLEIGLKPETI